MRGRLLGVIVLACGALALHVKAIAARNGLELDVHPLPPLLHNHPQRIAGALRDAGVDDVRGVT